MNQIPTILCLLTFAFSGLINTEAGTFRCYGGIVQLDRHGIPSSEEPGGKRKPCDPIVPVEDTI